MGDVTLFRLYRGSIKNGEEVWNAEHSVAEKLNHLSVQQGKERIEVPELQAGDIGSVAKLRDTHTNDTFCRQGSSGPAAADSLSRGGGDLRGVVVKQRGEEDKLAAGLHKLHEEDPTFHFEYSSELGQTLIHGMGERHFEIILGRLETEVRRPRRAGPAPGGLPGDAQGQGRGAGEAQEAERRARPVRRLLDPAAPRCRAAPATSSWTTSWAG